MKQLRALYLNFNLIFLLLSSAILASGYKQTVPTYAGPYEIAQFGAGMYNSSSAEIIVKYKGKLIAAYIDWVGVEDKTPPDTTRSVLLINDIEVEGYIIPGEAGYSEAYKKFWYAWQANIGPSGYDLIKSDSVKLKISGWDNPLSPETNGATITVIYEPPYYTPSKSISLFSGVDYYHFNLPIHRYPGLIVFEYEPAAFERIAKFYLSFAGTDANQLSCRGGAMWMLSGNGKAPEPKSFNIFKRASNGKGYGINGGVEIAKNIFANETLACSPEINPDPDQPYQAGHPYPGGAKFSPYRAKRIHPPDGGYISPEWSVVMIEVYIPANSSWTAFQFESERDKNGESGSVAGAMAFVIYEKSSNIGDYVWLDSNNNGIQDENEHGIAEVKVKLFDQNDNLIAVTTTNNSGFYLFPKIPSGNYKLQFEKPDNYAFTSSYGTINEAHNSDVINQDGFTEIFFLDEAENNMNIDAGLFLFHKKPDIFVSKSDGLIFQPDSLVPYVYYIKLKNIGPDTLYNSELIDTLPAGVEYIESYISPYLSVQPLIDNNIVKWNLGNIPPQDSAYATLTVRTINYYPEYLNRVWLTGKDRHGNRYYAFDEDLNIADTSSSGWGAGVESTPNLPEALLIRTFNLKSRKASVLFASTNRTFKLHLSSYRNLSEFFPEYGPYKSAFRISTPFDIPSVSNAYEALAYDYYLANKKRIASAFAAVTISPFVYDHSKQVCDRLNDYELLDLKIIKHKDFSFYIAKLRHQKNKTTDYYIPFIIWEEDGKFKISSEWNNENYTIRSANIPIYNFQLWSSSLEGVQVLLNQFLAKISSHGEKEFVPTAQPTPEFFISKAKYIHDNKIHLSLVNLNKIQKNLIVEIYYKLSQGDPFLIEQKNIVLSETSSDIAIDFKPISSALIKITDSNGFSDQVFISGGSFAFFVGPNTSIHDWTTSGYRYSENFSLQDGIILSGGAKINGELKDWISIIRTFSANSSSFDFSDYYALAFEANGIGTCDVILAMDNFSDYNYHSYTINLTPNKSLYILPFNHFKRRFGGSDPLDVSKISYAGIILDKAKNTSLKDFYIEIFNMAIIKENYTNISLSNLDYSLEQNYPNPFNPETIIEFSIKNPSYVKLEIFDALGKRIEILIDKFLNAGKYSAKFKADKLTSGVYFYRLTTEEKVISKKMILQK